MTRFNTSSFLPKSRECGQYTNKFKRKISFFLSKKHHESSNKISSVIQNGRNTKLNKGDRKDLSRIRS